MKKWISLFGVVFVTLWLAGCSAESNVKKGDKFYAIGEYFEAAAEYRKAYMRTKPKERAKRGERAYKAADCYRRINYTSRAIGSYQNAARYNYPDSIVYFYLAEMQRKNGDYKKRCRIMRFTFSTNRTTCWHVTAYRAVPWRPSGNRNLHCIR